MKFDAIMTCEHDQYSKNNRSGLRMTISFHSFIRWYFSFVTWSKYDGLQMTNERNTSSAFCTLLLKKPLNIISDDLSHELNFRLHKFADWGKCIKLFHRPKCVQYMNSIESYRVNPALVVLRKPSEAWKVEIDCVCFYNDDDITNKRFHTVFNFIPFGWASTAVDSHGI